MLFIPVQGLLPSDVMFAFLKAIIEREVRQKFECVGGGKGESQRCMFVYWLFSVPWEAYYIL
jgi:hypothetical protein